MLSFAIFVTFFVFLFSILQPMIKTGQDKQLALDSFLVELVNMLGPSLTNYTSGSIRTLDADFTTSLAQLAITYNNDYAGLKTNLKISPQDEFGFNFINTEGELEVLAEKNVPQSINIYTKKVPVYYSGGETNVLLGFINIKIW
jgi:hypothetical protein